MTQSSTAVQFPKRRDVRRRVAGRWLYAAALAVALVVVAVLVLVSQLGGRTAARPQAASLVGVTDSASLFAGIPQRGNVLGSPKAPVTLVEYADLQCPYCGEFARMALPTLVRTYVREGKVRLVFRGLAFVGPDSETGLRAVLAAGASGRLWQAVHLMYVNQGVENAGWVTPAFLRSVAGATHASLATADGAVVTAQIDEFAKLAHADGVSGTPAFLVGRSGRVLRPLVVRSLDAAAFRPALDSLLR